MSEQIEIDPNIKLLTTPIAVCSTSLLPRLADSHALRGETPQTVYRRLLATAEATCAALAKQGKTLPDGAFFHPTVVFFVQRQYGIVGMKFYVKNMQLVEPCRTYAYFYIAGQMGMIWN